MADETGTSNQASTPEPASSSPEPAPTEAAGGEVGTTAPSQADSTASPPRGQEDESAFFDPSDLSPELLPAYKQMQGAFTRKTQALKDQRSKIEAYDAFTRDPVGAMQTLAQQYGYSLTRREAENLAAGNTANNAEEWQPQTWDDVLQRATQMAEQNILDKLNPVLEEVRGVKKAQIETVLDQDYPDWRQYEDDMIRVLQRHPTLAEDPKELMRLAMPTEVLEGRAMQKALKKLDAKQRSSKVSGGSQTQRPASAGIDPNKPMSFNEAYQAARKSLEQSGELTS